MPIVFTALAVLVAAPFMVSGGKSNLSLSPSLGLNAKQNLPIVFVPNMGLSESKVSYLAHSAGGTLLFAPSEVVLTAPSEAGTEQPLRADLRMSFLGASETAN